MTAILDVSSPMVNFRWLDISQIQDSPLGMGEMGAKGWFWMSTPWWFVRIRLLDLVAFSFLSLVLFKGIGGRRGESTYEYHL